MIRTGCSHKVIWSFDHLGYIKCFTSSQKQETENAGVPWRTEALGKARASSG